MNAKQRYRAKRASEHRERKAAERRISRKIDALCGCSERVMKAISAARDTPVYDDMDNCCLPQVSLFKAGYRKSENISAR